MHDDQASPPAGCVTWIASPWRSMCGRESQRQRGQKLRAPSSVIRTARSPPQSRQPAGITMSFAWSGVVVVRSRAGFMHGR